MNNLSKLFLLVFVGLAVSCGTKNRVVTTTKKAPTREVVVPPKPKVQTPAPEVKPAEPVSSDPIAAYVATFAEVAKEEMALHGIPASITLAQGILESGAGKGDLCIRANNHFGIKCHGWTGESVKHDDDELQECFRKYDDPKSSYKDHSLFLTGRSRYARLFKLEKDDYKGWAKGLRECGYATDRKYPDKLISLIERYELYKYDAEVLGKPIAFSNPKTEVTTVQNQYMVKKGDTLYSISRAHGTTVEELQKNNNLRGTNISVGQLLFIEEPKE